MNTAIIFATGKGTRMGSEVDKLDWAAAEWRNGQRIKTAEPVKIAKRLLTEALVTAAPIAERLQMGCRQMVANCPQGRRIHQ